MHSYKLADVNMWAFPTAWQQAWEKWGQLPNIEAGEREEEGGSFKYFPSYILIKWSINQSRQANIIESLTYEAFH